MPVEPQAPYISSKEAAKKYGLTHDHVGLLCRRGKIEGLLWGRVWFVSEPTLVEYIQKNSELKEARKAALSKQWRGAWTVAFIGFFLFAASSNYVSADFVSMPARVATKVEASPVSLTALVAKVGELKELVPAPQIPELPKPVVKQVGASNNSFISNVHEGLAVVGESISNMFAAELEVAPAYKMRVTYAKDIKPQPTVQESISLFLTAAATNAGAVAATLPAPQLTYEAPHVEPILTAENLLAGMMLANETLSRLNDNMFALYLESLNSFVEVVAFDAGASAHVWEKTFGAFGERFVSDLAQLNDVQVGLYFAAADELDEAYNSFADSVEGSQMFNSPISVASVSFAPSMTIPGEKQVAAVWDGWIDLLVYTFFTQKTATTESPPQVEVSNNAPVSSKPAQPAVALDPKVLPVAPSKPSTNPTSLITPAPASYFSFAGLVTQEELNAQFSVWMQVVRALIAGNGNQTGYVDNPASAAIGAGGGVVNNFYNISQRIDRLDGVTITNSSINGVSDFSSLGTGFPATSTISIAYGGTGISTYPSYGQLLMGNGSGGYSLVATSSLGISSGSVSGSVGNWFVPTSIGNSTSTLLQFNTGFISSASSTLVGNAYFASTLQIGKSSGQVQVKTGDTASQLDIDFPDLATGAGSVRLFRSTNTTGNRLFSIYKGDGSNTPVFQVNATSGALTINGQNDDDNLIRLRGTGVGQRATVLWQNTAGTQTFGTISAHDSNDTAHLPTNHISIETTKADLTTTMTRLSVLWGVDQSTVQVSNADLNLDSNNIYSIGNTTSSMSSTTWQLVGANGTGSSTLLISNTTNSAVDAPAVIEARVGGNTTTGDPQLRLGIANGTTWHVGVDNSNNDLFEIGTSTTVGASGVGVLTVSTAGVVTANYNGGSLAVGDGSNTSTHITVAGGRTMFGYNGANAVVQGGTSKGIIFNVNNSSFGSGTAAIITSAGLMGIGTTSPWAQLSVNPSGLSGPAFVVGSSTATHFVVTNAGNVGIGTTTPGTLLSLGNTGANTVNISATATSTFGSGINIKSGCFAVNEVCLPSVDKVVTLSGTFATSTPGNNVDVVFTGAVDSAPSFSAASGGILTLPSNTEYYIVEVVGGGEGGGDGSTSNTGSGGTGGGYAKDFIYDTTASYYTVGARGAGSSGSGGSSCYGTNATACTSPTVSASGGSNSPGRGSGGVVNVAGSGNDGQNGGRSFYGAGATSTAAYVEIGGGGRGGSSSNGSGYAGGPGGLIIYVYTTSNAGADLAELYPVKDHNLTPGEIVTFSSALPITVGRAVQGQVLAGVVSTDPGIVLGNTKDPTGQRPIALAGRVPTKVNFEGGPIAIGDRIALSSVPGVGKRATLFEDSIGIAIENFDGTTGDSVMVFLDLQQGIDIGTISEGLLVGVSSNTTTLTTTTSEIASSTSIFNFGTRFLESLAAQLVQWFASASNGILTLFAKELHTEKLCVGNTCVSEEQFLAMVAASGQQSSPEPQAPTPEPEENASSTPPGAGQAPEVPAPDETTSSTSTISQPEVDDGHATSTPEVVLNEAVILESLSSTEE